MRRREFLQATGGAAATAGLLATMPERAAGTTENVPPAVVTQDGGTVEVSVGPDGEFVFSPGTDEVLAITPGTTVEFVWESNTHNVVPQSQPDGADWDGEGEAGTFFDSGHTYTHTFDTEGTYEYVCTPHQGLGMVGTIQVTPDPSAVTPTGTATPSGTSTPASTDEPSGNSGGGSTQLPDFGGYLGNANNGDTVEDLRGNDQVTVEVGAGSGFAFNPAGVWIDPGTTVQFEWTGEGGAHNVVAEDDATADLDSGGAKDTSGVGYEYTFEDGGISNYYCVPHQAQGMLGAIAVGNDVPTVSVGGGGGGPTDPEEMGVPFQAHWVGIATLLGIGLTLLLTFFFLKYGETPHSGYPEER